MSVVHLSTAEAAAYMVGHHGLRQRRTGPLDAVLRDLRCIQLDPLDPIGTNADLVAMARVDGVQKDDVYGLLGTHAFEHYAKERCLVPAHRFPVWRDHVRANPGWRHTANMKGIEPGVLDDVVAEVRERGPIAVSDLTGRGRTTPTDWSGWKGTSKLSTLAFDALWRQCRVVVVGRQGRGKVIDVPERAFPEHHDAPATGSFDETVLLDRVQAAGLLSMVKGPHWSSLYDARTSALPQRLVHEGRLEQVRVGSSKRLYLAPAGFRERTWPDDDGEMRILGPLDPLLWDRTLVHETFGFEYVWEVYKPASKRRWGWYVVPLLHRGALVGRLEAHTADGELVVDRVWREGAFDEDALERALTRHAAALGVAYG